MATTHERFEWDDAKAATNLTKHGVSFNAARIALKQDEQAYEEEDTKKDYGEKRVNSVVRAGRAVLTVCWTLRGQVTRIISARMASRQERKRYDELG